MTLTLDVVMTPHGLARTIEGIPGHDMLYVRPFMACPNPRCTRDRGGCRRNPGEIYVASPSPTFVPVATVFYREHFSGIEDLVAWVERHVAAERRSLA